MKVPDEFFNGGDLSDYEKEVIEKKMLENAFENSYRIITKRITFDDLIKDLSEGTITAALTAHDPDQDPPKIILENMISHFSSEEYEEYEKCVELKKELNRLYPETNDNK